MADSSPPRIVRSLTGGGGAKVFHAKKFNGETVPGGGGGGLERGFGGGGGPTRGFASGAQSGDPAVTGDFQHNPTTTFLHFPIAGGGLTDKGKRDQADSDLLNKGQLAYADAINGGATQTEAFTAAVRAGGGAPYLSALMSHPSTPLANLPTAHAFLSGGQPSGPQSTQVKGADGKIYNVDVNPDGSMGNPRDVGLPGTPSKPEKPGTPKVIQTPNGPGTLQADGTVKPLTWSGGGGGNTTANGILAPPPGTPTPGSPVGAPPAAAAKPKNLTSNELTELQGLQRVLPALDVAQSNMKAATAGGITSVGRFIGEYTPWGGEDVKQYTKSLDQLKASIAGAMQGSTRLKAAYNQMNALIPSLYDSEGSARDDFNNLSHQMRNSVATMKTVLQGEGKDTSVLDPLIKQYNADPAYMAQVNQWRAQLRDNPGQISSNDLQQIYAAEAFRPDQGFALPQKEEMALFNEVDKRGLWGMRSGIVGAYPDRSYLPDEKDIKRQYGTELQQMQDQANGVQIDPTTGGKVQGQPNPNPQAPIAPTGPAPPAAPGMSGATPGQQPTPPPAAQDNSTGVTVTPAGPAAAAPLPPATSATPYSSPTTNPTAADEAAVEKTMDAAAPGAQ